MFRVFPINGFAKAWFQKWTKLCGILICISSTLRGAEFMPSKELPPTLPREFRGAWVATVNNIDWPSRPGLSSLQQQQELRALLDQAARLHLNAVLFQVRPACDALYGSKIEPWSEYLTGTMGRPPEPLYDPLALAIQEAHDRGIELHAWFNPFRARHHAALSALSANHISKTKPQWVHSYGKYLWLDPGEPGVLDYSLKVILDVVRRYDIDGVHLDDYFYPYPEKDSRQRPIEFPDSSAYRRYQKSGGKLSREDWRREQVNTFVRRLYTSVKVEKPYLKVGISPFGIWRPKNPPSIEGLDSYEQLFADSKKWWNQGWVDYLAPQLYWSIDSKEQSFPVLLRWWQEQNLTQRHLWPGLNTANVGSRIPPVEILNEIGLIRRTPGVGGETHWSIKALSQNRAQLGDQLLAGPYSVRALVPSAPWLDRTPPAKPALSAPKFSPSQGYVLDWTCTESERPRWWLVQMRISGQWHSELFPGAMRNCSFPPTSTPEIIAVSAVDRSGNQSTPSVLESVGGSTSTTGAAKDSRRTPASPIRPPAPKDIRASDRFKPSRPLP